MKLNLGNSQALLLRIRNKQPMTLAQQIKLTVELSLPAMLAQLSFIVMEYIDASMVGRLGTNQAAAIGLVSSSLWLFGGLAGMAVTGFSVQVAQLIGAGNEHQARNVLRQAITSIFIFCMVLFFIGVAVSQKVPVWLGGDKAIQADASTYFLIFIISLPLHGLNYLAGSMLRCSGNMRVPSLLNVLMCVLDVIFNFFLIFPSATYHIGFMNVWLPGAHLGVAGAALGTVLAECVTICFMMGYLVTRSKELRLTHEKGSFVPEASCLRRALKIGLPMGCQHLVMCGAQVVSTIIVAPLGVLSIAANSFAITAESLCYMPGYGIADAATTLVGQCVGAQRQTLTRRFAHITVLMGMAVMTFMGIIMYIAAPLMMSIMTPNVDIQSLGVMALRIEAFAEPMFAASIVVYGAFVGAGDTTVPSIMNFASMWGVRLTLAALLAPVMGLRGVWIAMCVELCFRGVIFLIRLNFRKTGYFSRKISTESI